MAASSSQDDIVSCRCTSGDCSECACAQANHVCVAALCHRGRDNKHCIWHVFGQEAALAAYNNDKQQQPQSRPAQKPALSSSSLAKPSQPPPLSSSSSSSSWSSSSSSPLRSPSSSGSSSPPSASLRLSPCPGRSFVLGHPGRVWYMTKQGSSLCEACVHETFRVSGVLSRPDLTAHTGVGSCNCDHIQSLKSSSSPSETLPLPCPGRMRSVHSARLWYTPTVGVSESYAVCEECFLQYVRWDVASSSGLTFKVESSLGLRQCHYERKSSPPPLSPAAAAPRWRLLHRAVRIPQSISSSSSCSSPPRHAHVLSPHKQQLPDRLCQCYGSNDYVAYECDLCNYSDFSAAGMSKHLDSPLHRSSLDSASQRQLVSPMGRRNHELFLAHMLALAPSSSSSSSSSTPESGVDPSGGSKSSSSSSSSSPAAAGVDRYCLTKGASAALAAHKKRKEMSPDTPASLSSSLEPAPKKARQSVTPPKAEADWHDMRERMIRERLLHNYYFGSSVNFYITPDGIAQPQLLTANAAGADASDDGDVEMKDVGGSDVNNKNKDDHDDLCIICFERPKTAIFGSCGHQSSCIECSDKLTSCPYCGVAGKAVLLRKV